MTFRAPRSFRSSVSQPNSVQLIGNQGNIASSLPQQVRPLPIIRPSTVPARSLSYQPSPVRPSTVPTRPSSFDPLLFDKTSLNSSSMSNLSSIDTSKGEMMYRVKGTSGYMTSSQKNTFEFLLYLLIILILVVLIIAIYNVFSYTPRRLRKSDTGYKPINDPDFVDTDVGGSIDGWVSLKNAENLQSDEDYRCEKKKGKIVCREPFYGPDCTLEAWDNHFYAFGDTTNANIKGLLASDFKTSSSKTWVKEVYSDNSCSKQSLNDPSSIGFAYNDGKCRLLYGELEVVDPSLVSYNPLVETEIYLKRTNIPSRKPKVKGEVCFGIKSNGFLRHYLNRSDTNSFVKVKTGMVKEVSIQPYFSHNPYSYKGIWSTDSFTAEQFDGLYNQGGSLTHFIDDGTSGGKILLPSYLRKHKKFYVMYVENTM